MRKVLLSIVLVLVFSVAAGAETTIKAEVDRKSMTTDEELIYKITVVSDQKDPPEVQLPRLEGFDVISSAESSTVSFADKGMKTHFLYVLVLVPRTAGSVKIPSARLKTRAGSTTTESFEIEVRPGKKPAVPQDQSQVTI